MAKIKQPFPNINNVSVGRRRCGRITAGDRLITFSTDWSRQTNIRPARTLLL